MHHLKNIKNIDRIYENNFSKFFNYITYRPLNCKRIINGILLMLTSTINKFKPEKTSSSPHIYHSRRQPCLLRFRTGPLYIPMFL